MTPEQIEADEEADAVAAAMIAFEAKQKAESRLREGGRARRPQEAEKKAFRPRSRGVSRRSWVSARSAQRSAAGDRRRQVGDRAAKREKGLDFARYIRAKAAAQMDHKSIADVLNGWADKNPGTVTRVREGALERQLRGHGLARSPEWASDFIELLRVKTSIRKAGART
jgi:hypothetical protein